MTLMWILALNHAFHSYGWVCVVIAAIAAGLMLYMQRYEKKKLLKRKCKGTRKRNCSRGNHDLKRRVSGK
jgi:type II secretory pathway component PulF